MTLTRKPEYFLKWQSYLDCWVQANWIVPRLHASEFGRYMNIYYLKEYGDPICDEPDAAGKEIVPTSVLKSMIRKSWLISVQEEKKSFGKRRIKQLICGRLDRFSRHILPFLCLKTWNAAITPKGTSIQIAFHKLAKGVDWRPSEKSESNSR